MHSLLDVHLNALLFPPEVPVRSHVWNIPSGEHWSTPFLSQEYLNCVKVIQVPCQGMDMWLVQLHSKLCIEASSFFRTIIISF